MPAFETLMAGDPVRALDELQMQVRAEPAEGKHRVFLFQLLALLGDWNRALTQLEVSGDLDPGNLAMVQVYREALRCEALRAEVFAGLRSPLIFGEPEEWIAPLVRALAVDAQGDQAQAKALREAAFEAASQTAGTITIEDRAAGSERELTFDWIADADTRTGPLLEAVVVGRYYWVPFHRISAVHVEKPADLRDLVWTPAFFTWSNGGEAAGLIPTRYPGSEQSADHEIRMARKTEWREDAAGQYAGDGQRLLSTDSGEYALMDIRKISFAMDGAGESGSAPSDG